MDELQKHGRSHLLSPANMVQPPINVSSGAYPGTTGEGRVKSIFLRIFIALVLAAGWGCGRKTVPLANEARPPNWASPVTRTGLPNLFKVSADLYRGSQPSRAGILELRSLGIKTIVNLRSWDDDDDDMTGTAMGYVGIPFHLLHPEDEDVVRFLKVVTAPTGRPVFVHCMRGIDRTGTMIAIYRMVVEGWPKDDAIREMQLGGYGYDNASPVLIRYLRALDVSRIKQAAGLH